MSDMISTTLLPEPWMRSSTCGEIGGDAWFPEPGDGDNAAKAKRVCREVCPVAAECLEFALRTGQQEGIWAGYAAKSLKRIRRERNLR